MLHEWIASQWRKRGLLYWLLGPLSWLYGVLLQTRKSLYRHGALRTFRAPVPVVVVGNIYVGGTGKTPVIIGLIAALQSRGWRPGLVSRGYGSRSKAEPVAGSGTLDVSLFGDEPAMISSITGVCVAVHADRAAAVRKLLERDPGIDVVLSDDGLQHWALERDIEILVQDDRGTGNGLLMPAGPLREPATRGREVNAVLTRRSANSLQASLSAGGVLHAEFAVDVSALRHLKTGRVIDPQTFINETGQAPALLAMAGIGVPQRFFDTLNSLGITPSRTVSLPDHGRIDPAWLSRQPEGTILMTEKDAVRIHQPKSASQHRQRPGVNHSHAPEPQPDPRIWVAVASTRWSDDGLFDWLDARLRSLQ